MIAALLRPFERAANSQTVAISFTFDSSTNPRELPRRFPFSPSPFTLLHLGIDVNGPQSELLVLVNHPPRGLPVEFSIWLDADVSPPGSQHPNTADTAHPRPRHHPLPLVPLVFFLLLRERYGVVYHKERIATSDRLSGDDRLRLARGLSREEQHARLPCSLPALEKLSRDILPFLVTISSSV